MSNRSADNFSDIRIEDNDRVAPRTRPASPPPPAAPSSTLTSIAFALALIASGVCGYLYYLHTQTLTTLTSAQARIADLENQLSATGEEMGSSTVALQAKLKELAAKSEELWEQMDKLWASAWRRNQKELRDLEKVVEDNRTNLQKGQNGLTSDIAKTNKEVSAFTLDISNIQNEVLAVNLEIESVKQSLLSGQSSVNTINDKISILEQRNNSLKQKLTQLERTVATLRMSPAG